MSIGPVQVRKEECKDFEMMLRKLRDRTMRERVFLELRIRTRFPNKSGRKRFKKYVSAIRSRNAKAYICVNKR